jgi:uncharacterized protein (DUF1697 family)
MQTYIALLRGINVGGHNKLPMKALRGLLENLGLQNVQTYIQSGRVFYLHAPDGIGRSKLAEKVARFLGVSTTARNWRTVSKMLEMVAAF